VLANRPGGLSPSARTRQGPDAAATGAAGSCGGLRARYRARNGAGAAAHGSIVGSIACRRHRFRAAPSHGS
jgi:hypothetical protein